MKPSENRVICCGTVVALAAFAVFNFFVGTQFVVSPVIGALLTVVVVPLASFMFFENNADLRTMTEPSAFIGRGRLRKGFFVRPLLQAIGLGAAEIIYYLISSGYDGTDPATADALTELSRSGFFILFIFGLLFTCLANLSDRGIIGIIKAGNTMSWLVSGIMIAVSLALVFVPVVNTAFGLAAPEMLTLLVGVAMTVIFQIPAELIGLSLKRLKE